MYSIEDLEKIIEQLQKEGFIVTGELLIKELKRLEEDKRDTQESDYYDLNTHPHA